MKAVWRWVYLFLLFLASLTFFAFGVERLIFSYKLTNPFEFIVLFFSSSLMVLVGGTFLVGLFFKLRRGKESEEAESESDGVIS